VCGVCCSRLRDFAEPVLLRCAAFCRVILGRVPGFGSSFRFCAFGFAPCKSLFSGWFRVWALGNLCSGLAAAVFLKFCGVFARVCAFLLLKIFGRFLLSSIFFCPARCLARRVFEFCRLGSVPCRGARSLFFFPGAKPLGVRCARACVRRVSCVRVCVRRVCGVV
jgi:hypothetical protein